MDIEYKVEEKPSDQIELSGGWGGGRVVGSLGLTFTNFSSKKMFERDSWRPIPTGDGQSVSIRAQSNGLFFQSYNMSFIESWLGGKEPTSLSVALSKSVQSNGQPKLIDGEINELRNSLEIIGVKVGLGKRLKKPDDWFLVPVFAVIPKFQPRQLRFILQLLQRKGEQFSRENFSWPKLDKRPYLSNLGFKCRGECYRNDSL